MIGLSDDELLQFVQEYTQNWLEEKTKAMPGVDLTLSHAVIAASMSQATALITANNKRIEDDLRRLGLIT